MSGYPNAQNNPGGAIPVYGSGAVPADNGAIVLPDAWPRTFSYNGDGTLNYSEITDPVTTDVFRQTFTYNGSGQITAQTAWEVQP